MKHLQLFIFSSALIFQLVACAAPTPTPTPTAMPLTNTPVPTKMAPTATHPATRVPNTPSPTETSAPQAASSDQILDMTWTRDGKQIVAATGDTLLVYDAGNLDSFTELEMPQETSIVQSLPTELALAIGIRDTIRLVTPQGKFLSLEWRGGTGKPTSISSSANGRRIAAGFDGYLEGSLGNVAVWDHESGRLAGVVPVYGPVTRVAFKNDDSALLIASNVNSCGRGGGGVSIWTFNGAPEPLFNVNSNSILDLAVSPAENIAATITQHGQGRCTGPAVVDVWNIDTKEILKTIDLQADASALAYSPDGALLAIGTNDGRVQLWDMHAQKTVQEFQVNPGSFVRLAFRPDGKALAAAQDTVNVWAVDLP